MGATQSANEDGKNKQFKRYTINSDSKEKNRKQSLKRFVSSSLLRHNSQRSSTKIQLKKQNVEESLNANCSSKQESNTENANKQHNAVDDSWNKTNSNQSNEIIYSSERRKNAAYLNYRKGDNELNNQMLNRSNVCTIERPESLKFVAIENIDKEILQQQPIVVDEQLTSNTNEKIIINNSALLEDTSANGKTKISVLQQFSLTKSDGLLNNDKTESSINNNEKNLIIPPLKPLRSMKINSNEELALDVRCCNLTTANNSNSNHSTLRQSSLENIVLHKLDNSATNDELNFSVKKLSPRIISKAKLKPLIIDSAFSRRVDGSSSNQPQTNIVNFASNSPKVSDRQTKKHLSEVIPTNSKSFSKNVDDYDVAYNCDSSDKPMCFIRREHSMPSIMAATVIGTWRQNYRPENKNGRPNSQCYSLKNIHPLTNSANSIESTAQEKKRVIKNRLSENCLFSNDIRGASASDDSLERDDFPIKGYHISNQSHEVLMQGKHVQIIRCFPFPSPRSSPTNSPKSKKVLTRTVSNDVNLVEDDSSTPPSPSLSFLLRSPKSLFSPNTDSSNISWNFTKRFLNRHHPQSFQAAKPASEFDKSTENINSNNSSNNNSNIIESTKSNDTMGISKHLSFKSSFPNGSLFRSESNSTFDQELNGGNKRRIANGALSRLCQVF